MKVDTVDYKNKQEEQTSESEIVKLFPRQNLATGSSESYST